MSTESEQRSGSVYAPNARRHVCSLISGTYDARHFHLVTIGISELLAGKPDALRLRTTVTFRLVYLKLTLVKSKGQEQRHMQTFILP